jgi:uncharacterized protein YjbJ (UPF0337 family)
MLASGTSSEKIARLGCLWRRSPRFGQIATGLEALKHDTSGKSDEVKGRVKQAAGALTGDKKLERQGKVDQAAGKLKQAAEKVKKKAEKAIDDAKDALS